MHDYGWKRRNSIKQAVQLRERDALNSPINTVSCHTFRSATVYYVLVVFVTAASNAQAETADPFKMILIGDLSRVSKEGRTPCTVDEFLNQTT